MEEFLRGLRNIRRRTSRVRVPAVPDWALTTDNDDFPPIWEILGELGEGYVLGKPKISKQTRERGHWIDDDFDKYLESDVVRGRRLEAASLVDLAKYNNEKPHMRPKLEILCWRPAKGRVVAFHHCGGGARLYLSYKEGGSYNFNYRVLLRKIRQQP